MPSSPCPNPANISANLENGELVKINGDEVALRAAPGTGSTILKYISYGTIVSRLEKATETTNGYYWDRVSTPYGYGYIARGPSDGSKLWLVPVSDTNNSTSNNKLSEPNDDNIITVEPNVTVDDIKEKYSEAILLDKNNEEMIGTVSVGTGAKIKIDGVEKYTIVKLGDVNGDGKITPSDYVKIKNHIMGATTLEGIYKEAADPSLDGKITPSDYVKVKNHIMGASKIQL